MRRTKKLVSMLLAFALIVSMLPAVLAASAPVITDIKANGTSLQAEGTYYVLNIYPGEKAYLEFSAAAGYTLTPPGPSSGTFIGDGKIRVGADAGVVYVEAVSPTTAPIDITWHISWNADAPSDESGTTEALMKVNVLAPTIEKLQRANAAGMMLDHDDSTITLFNKLREIAVVTKPAGEPVVWSFEPAGYAEIVEEGGKLYLKALKPSTDENGRVFSFYATATLVNNPSESKSFTLEVEPYIWLEHGGTAIENGGTLNVPAGESITPVLKHFPADAAITDLTWQITNGGTKASVDATGTVTGINVGEATLRITCKVNNRPASFVGTVKVGAAETVMLDPASLTMTAGNTGTITVTTSYGSSVTWTVDNSGIISLTANGNTASIQALTPGTATVTASLPNRTCATCTVTVDAAPGIIFPPATAATVQKYTVDYTAGEGGTVGVSSKTVLSGGEATYTVIPAEGYKIVSVQLNGKDVELEADGTLKVTNINRNQMLNVVFAKIAWVNPYSDVTETDADYAVIQAVSEAGVMNGIDGAFAADGDVSAAMFVTMLGRLHGVDPAQYTSVSFLDVKADDYFAPFVEWAHLNGIVVGIGEGIFGLDDKISVERAVTILARYAHFAGLNVTGGAALQQYSDADKLAGWAADAMAWAVAEDIYAPTGTLNPQDSASRIDVARMLYALMVKLDK